MTSRTPAEGVVVIDNALDDAALSPVRDWLANARMAPVGGRGRDRRLYSATDPSPLTTDALRVDLDDYEGGVLASAAATLVRHVCEVAELRLPTRADVGGYAYPRRSRLLWHTDGGQYAGAVVLYLHDVWSSTWGGQLMIHGDGGVHVAIEPKPNRLVYVRQDVRHAILPVHDDAGDRERLSLFVKILQPKR